MSGYEQIQNLKKETGYKIPNLLAQARQNDPFFTGSPTDVAMAEWFAGLWGELGLTSGVHLRRIHYRLVSQREPIKHDGSPYENTERDWGYLCAASKYARRMGMVDASDFVDRRNPEPQIHMHEPPGEPGWDYHFEDWMLPGIYARLEEMISLEMPNLYPTGYEYNEGLQPYHLEVWAEKSTMNDVLRPLCNRYAVNLITGVGELSITAVIWLLLRVHRLEKPCRILYISDFDPSGQSMPVSVSREIEYWNTGADIKLNPLILTADQVLRWQLPRTPIKDSDRSKDKFEARHGEGATELDALEALYPGELERIVSEAISGFRDSTLLRRTRETWRQANSVLRGEQSALEESYGGELEEIREAVEETASRYEGRLEAMNAALQAELQPYRDRLDSLRQAIQNELDELEPEIPGMPEPETSDEQDGWLFDSGREYMEQLEHYKEFQGRGGE